ncbi:MAG: C39 family peptidase [Pirellula sp.]
MIARGIFIRSQSKNPSAVPSILLVGIFIGCFTGFAFGQETNSQLSNEPDERSLVPIWDQTRQFSVFVRNAKEIRTAGTILQQRDFSCGAAALATVLNKFWGDKADETSLLIAIATTLTRAELEERIKNGLTLTDLKRVCDRFGYTTILGKLTIDKLAESKVPLIVGITVNDYDHFVVVRGADKQFVYLADPATGRMRVPIEEFAEQWQKNAVLVVVKPKTLPPKNSPLALTEEEKTVGESNRYFIRNNLTGRP